MHIGCLIQPEFDFSGFGLVNQPRQILGWRHCARLGIWHQAARAQDAPKTPHRTHHFRHGDSNIEPGPAILDFLDGLFICDEVHPGLFRQARALSLDERQNAHSLAKPVWKLHRGAHLLVRLACIDTQPDVNFNGFIEVRSGALLGQFHRLTGGVELVSLN